jgi:3-phytase
VRLPGPLSASGIVAFVQRDCRITLSGMLIVVCLTVAPDCAAAAPPAQVRVATFNASLNRNSSGDLVRDLSTADNEQARQVAEILQRVRPDVVLLNEFDYDADGDAARLFQENYLAVSQHGQSPLTFADRFSAPVNTGEPSGLDLDHDGRSDGPGDAYGFGRHPGQYGMVVYSQFPIDRQHLRTFRKFLWRDMPDALVPVEKTGQPFYDTEIGSRFRLSSKSHWDLPLSVGGRTLHLLAAHPTPPVFDGPEDRNGCRNHDEIRFWADYIDPGRSGYVYDDDGQRGGLPEGAAFVIVGDMNADPLDGDSTDGAVVQLLTHPLVRAEPVPTSRGAVEASLQKPEPNQRHHGDPARDTSDFNGPGNLRIDYVLPSRTLLIRDCSVFWPSSGEPGADLVGVSDHRLVWIDIAWAPSAD